VAGIIINLGAGDALDRYRGCGAYSTILHRKGYTRKGWGTAGEATIADYLSVTEGDQVFLFSRRFIYGIGNVVRLPGARAAALSNYPQSWDLRIRFGGKALWCNEPDDLADHPFVIFFEPSPHWFPNGVDMDEVLAADSHGYVASLPFFSGSASSELMISRHRTWPL